MLAVALCATACGSSNNGSGPSAGGAGGTAAVGGAGGVGGLGGAAGAAGTGGAASTACNQPPKDFWTWDLTVMPPVDKQVNATCVAETDHAYVYVATDTWNAGKMTQAQVDTIADAFEKSTPADGTRGIYKTDTDTFGAPPDVDGDPHVYLLYYPMGSFNGTSFDGYFRDTDESQVKGSNQLEMLHLNSEGPFAPDTDYMLGVVIHEFVHLINWKYDKGEEGWLNEALAESAMTLGGYMTDLPAGKQYVKSTAGTALCVTGYSSYGATFSWGSYMLDRWGTSFLTDVLQDPAHGIASIESHLPQGTFRDAFGDFMVANLLDQPSIGDGRYGYKSFDQSALGSETAGTIDSADHTSTAVAWGARMLRFSPSSAGTLSLTLDSADFAKLVVSTVVVDPAQPSGATVKRETLSAQSTQLDIQVGAGQVVDVVVAVDAGASVDATQAAKTNFTYNATLAP